jgi:putative membrane protein
MGRRRPPLHDEGHEPDARFTFANERTFLAWNRTALALMAAGLAVVQLLPSFRVPGGRRIIGLPLITLGAVISFTSYRRWEGNERALRLGRPLPPSRLPQVLAVTIALAGLAAGIIALFGRAS